MIDDIPDQDLHFKHQTPEHHTGVNKTLAAAVILSFIFGTFGGIFGYSYIAPKLPQLANKTGSETISNQQVNLTEDSAVINVVKQASPGVVSIVATRELQSVPGFGIDPFEQFFGPNYIQPSKSYGTGFFVSDNGLILTNKHVASDLNASYTVITSDGKQYEAKVVAQDPRNDLAIMKVEINDTPFLTLADSSQIQIGQRVIAIGNSLGQYQNTVTTGVVSGIGRSITAGSSDGVEQLEGVIQTDAAINPGNSGGPLLNSVAQVIGINTAIDRQGQLVGFAIPSKDAAKALESYKTRGKIVRPYIGIRYVMISPALAQAENLSRDYGALLVRGDSSGQFAVITGSPAAKAGLKEGDIILEIDGKKLEGDNNLARLLRDKNVGDEVMLKVYQDGEEREVRVILEEAK